MFSRLAYISSIADQGAHVPALRPYILAIPIFTTAVAYTGADSNRPAEHPRILRSVRPLRHK